MGAFDGWASAALGGGIGGTATGIALFFTVRHDHTARANDRRHATADRALAAAGDLAAPLIANAPNGDLVRPLMTFTQVSIAFQARLTRRDTHTATALDTLQTEIGARFPANFERDAPFTAAEKMHAATTVTAYIDVVRTWIANPKSLRKTPIDTAALIARFDSAGIATTPPGA